MNRREFNQSLIGLSVATLLPRQLLSEEAADTPSPAIVELYKKSLVMDSLCGLFADPNPNPTPELIATIRASGISGINNTISEPEFEATLNNIATVEAWVENYPESLHRVFRDAAGAH